MFSIESLPFKGTSLRKPKEIKLSDDLLFEQWIVPKETIIKIFESKNFGYVILPDNCQDKRGFIIPRRIFRY
jgi:hypothetical protein